MLGIVLLVIGVIFGLSGLSFYRRNGFLWKAKESYLSQIEDSESSSSYGGINALIIGAFFVVLGTIVIIKALVYPKDITIEGVNVSFPCTYLDIQAMGFDIEEGQEIVELKGTENSYNPSGKTYTVVDDSGRRFKIRFENHEEETKLATACEIYKMTFEYAPPKNMYEGMSNYGYLYNSWQQDVTIDPELLEQAMEDYNNMLEEKKEYYENYEILNSPKLTLGNKVNSDMTQAQVEGIMGRGQSPTVMVVTPEYYATREYYMSTADKRLKVTITYVTKDQIAEITISQ